jgi:RNA polymerase sigma-70 factor (ECF subfamily)
MPMTASMVPTNAVVDCDVIDRARDGDRAALGELWRVYQPQLLRFLRATGAATAEDIASEVWMDVGRALRRFEGDGRALQRWLFTIARRRNIDEARRLARRKESAVPVDEHRELASTSDPSLEIAPLENALALVSALPTQMAEAVMLRIVHDLSVEDVAAIMQISEANVRVITHRGLTKLRARARQDRSASELLVSSAPTGIRFAATFATNSDRNL